MTNSLALVIEDDTSIANIFAMTLRLADYHPETINDGNAAIERLRILKPQLIMLDLKLPGISGAEILNFIRQDERLKQTWVIVASANAEQALALGERKDEFLHILIKPVGVTELIQLARRLKQSSAT
jgi:CheY-like chemotaxis protein